MNDVSHLPSRRLNLVGVDLDGRALEIAFAVGRQLYKCPGCHDYIQVGAEHVVVRLKDPGGTPYHQHWHRDCAHRILVRDMRSLQERRA